MLFERNLKGDTPLSICIKNKNQKAVDLLEKLQVTYDKTSKNADDLLAALEAEEQKAEREKKKRKEKKQKAKLQKLADKDNCTIEEAQKRIEADRQAKILQEK